VVMSLNFDEAIGGSIVECSVGEICWALYEIERFGNYYNENFSTEMYNDDPSIYVAGCVASEGYIVLPEDLDFCEEEFTRMHPLSKRTPPELTAKIRKLAEGDLVNEVNEDDPLQVQIAKLQECRVYKTKRLEALNRQLLQLGS